MSTILNTFACFFRWFSSYSSLISFTPYRVSPWSVTLFHLAIRMKALQVSVQSSAAMSSMGVFSTMKQKPMRVMTTGMRKTQMRICLQSRMKQKAMGLMAVPTAKDSVIRLKYWALFCSGKNSTMKVVMMVNELASPPLQRKTPMIAHTCEWININTNPTDVVSNPKLVVPLRPRCSVKKMVTKTPITDPNMIDVFRNVTKSDPSHRKSPKVFARLMRPSGAGEQVPRSSGGRLQTCSLQLAISELHWQLCQQKMQGLMRRQAEPSMPMSTMKMLSRSWYLPSVPTFSSMLQQMRSFLPLLSVDMICYISLQQYGPFKHHFIIGNSYQKYWKLGALCGWLIGVGNFCIWSMQLLQDTLDVSTDVDERGSWEQAGRFGLDKLSFL